MWRVENVMENRKKVPTVYIVVIGLLVVAVALAGYVACNLLNIQATSRQTVEVKVPSLPGEGQPLVASDNPFHYKNDGIVTEIVPISENPHLSMIRFVTSDENGEHTQLLGGIVATGDVVISDRVHCVDKEVYNHPNQRRTFLRPCVKEVYSPGIIR